MRPYVSLLDAKQYTVSGVLDCGRVVDVGGHPVGLWLFIQLQTFHPSSHLGFDGLDYRAFRFC